MLHASREMSEKKCVKQGTDDGGNSSDVEPAEHP